MEPRFAGIDCWIFDLDNTLYPASCDLFALIDERMGLYIQRTIGCDAAEARRIQKGHFHTHGTTLAGMMADHGVDPRAVRLLQLVELARRDGVVSGRYAAVGPLIEQLLTQRKGTPIPMNIDAATAVIFCELGFAPPLGRGLA